MGAGGLPLAGSPCITPSPVVQAAQELVWALRWLVPAGSSGTVWGRRKQAAFGDWVERSAMNCGCLGETHGPFERHSPHGLALE